MKTNLRLIASLAAVCILLLSTKPAYSYLDPGTGSMMIQAVIAGIAAASVSIGIFRRRLLSFFSRLFRRQKGVGDDPHDK